MKFEFQKDASNATINPLYIEKAKPLNITTNEKSLFSLLGVSYVKCLGFRIDALHRLEMWALFLDSS